MNKLSLIISVLLLSFKGMALSLNCTIHEPCSGSVNLGYCLEKEFRAFNNQIILKVGQVTTMTEMLLIAPTLSYQVSSDGQALEGLGWSIKRDDESYSSGYILVPYG